jgi:MATE family multidrug resistance protein
MSFFKNHIHPLLLLTIPLIITGLLQSSIYFFQTIFLAHLGLETLAAGALVGWLFGTFLSIVIGILSSINILVAHHYGAKEYHTISLIVRDGVWIALFLAIPSFVFFWNLSPIFLFLGQNPTLVKLAEVYLHGLAWGLLPNFVMFALLEFIVGLGHARVILIFTLLSVFLSIFLSYTLIFGTLGFPALGIAGAGLGVSISYWISALTLVIYVVYKKQYKTYLSHLFTPTKRSYILELFKIGLPMGLMFCIEVGFFFVLSLIMGSINAQLLAANQIALQYMGALMSIVFSIAQGVTVRMGHLLGANEVRAAQHTAYTGILFSALLMLIIAVFDWSIPTILISIDINVHNPQNFELIHYTTQLLAVSAFFQLFESMRITFFGALRSLKDTRFTLIISIISFWGVALPVGYLLNMKLNTNGTGLWWGMVISAVLSVCILLWRFKYKINLYLCN